MDLLLDPIESKLTSVLKDLQREGPAGQWNQKKWTQELKSRLAELGSELGYAVYTSSTPRATGGEWLFDVTWIEASEGYLLGLPLVLECEWSPDGASHDFQKLLIARAERRVMILASKSDQGPQGAIEALIEEVDHCKLSTYGDRYLFACWHEPEEQFTFRLHIAR